MKAEQEGYSPEQIERFEESWKKLSQKIEVSDVAGPVKVAPPRLEDIPRFKPSLWPPPEENLQKNLDKYIKLARDLGATDAKVIHGKDIPLDLRALFIGCLNPSCRWLDTNANCPMKAFFRFELIKEYLSSYGYAIAYKVLPPVMDAVPDVGPIKIDKYYTAGGGETPDQKMLARNIIRLRILLEMNRRIRQAVYYDGYIMTASVGNAPCLVAKCSQWGGCAAIAKGGHCRFVDTSPAGPAAYIDYHTLARKMGWGELQVGGNCAFLEDVPDPAHYFNIGLVLVE